MSTPLLSRSSFSRRLIGVSDVGRIALLVGLVATLPRCSALSPDCSATASCNPASGGASDAGKTTATGGAVHSDASGGASSGGGGNGGAPANETGDATAGGATPGTGGAPTSPPDGGTPSSTPESGLVSCSAGTADCDQNSSDGCEVTLATDVDHCGSCNTSCSSVGAATRACQTGVCKLTCDPQHRDCDTNVSTGCEVDIETDVANCGGCEKVCQSDGTTSRACVNGVCKPTCDAKHADCDQNGANGCEQEIDDDVADCGACGHVCSSTGTTSRACSAGACKPTCTAPLADCSTPKSPAADDGCEADLTAPTSCGACGHDCLDGACSNERCQPYKIANDVDQFIIGGNYVSESFDDSSVVGWNSATDKTFGDFSTSSESNSLQAADAYYVFWVNNVFDSNNQEVSTLERSPSGSTTAAPFPAVPASVSKTTDGTNMYWMDASNAVHQTNEATGKDVIFSNIFATPGGLITDGKHLFVIQSFSIASLPVGGGPAVTTSVSVPDQPHPVIADASNIYFWSTGASTYNISWLPKTLVGTPGAIPTDVPSSDSINVLSNLAAAGGYVYFVQSDGIYRVTTAPGALPQQVVQNTNGIRQIGVTSKALFWVDNTPTATLYRLAVF